jgi:hypothetical protein
MWVKLDDHFDQHPKLAQVGPLGIALWTVGLAYCNRQLTDGFIPWAQARSLISWEFLGPPCEDGRQNVNQIAITSGMAGTDVTCAYVIDLLVSAGLWDVVDGGYQVHDYDQYQPTREQVEAERKAKQEAGRAGGLARAKALAVAPAIADAKAGAVAKSKPVPVTRYPLPVPDPPSSSSNAHAREAAREPGWDAIEQRWQELAEADPRPLTKAQLTAASAELTRAVERGDEALFWSSMQATAEGGKPWNWFMTRVRGQLNGDVHEPITRAPPSSSNGNGRAPPRTRDPDGRPRDLAGRYRDKIQRA